jgi:hypothetical protein
MRPDVFPPNHAGFISAAWLAYASACTLSGAGAGEGPPLLFMGQNWNEYGGHKLKYTWRNSEALPRLPEFIVEYADEEAFSLMEADRTRFGKPPLPAVYRQGFTNAIYQVMTWTNIAGLHLPLRFRFSRYVPKADGAQTNELEVQLSYDGYANTVSESVTGAVGLALQFPKLTRIADYRLGPPGAQPLLYMSEDGRVPTLDDAKRVRAGIRQSSVGTKSTIRAVLFSLAIGPVVLFLFLWWRRKHVRDQHT